MDRGEFYLEDAADGERETLTPRWRIAEPIQCMRLPGPSFLPMIAADFTGLAFIVATFHFYRLAVAFMALQLAVLSRVGIVFIAAPLVFVRSCV